MLPTTTKGGSIIIMRIRTKHRGIHRQKAFILLLPRILLRRRPPPPPPPRQQQQRSPTTKMEMRNRWDRKPLAGWNQRPRRSRHDQRRRRRRPRRMNGSPITTKRAVSIITTPRPAKRNGKHHPGTYPRRDRCY